ncbi:lytic transglycosylase domain-containing protein [Candidatus Thiosymbion oneisti]|uniref:lytic transglycosylase domain-containing protein n=1 Tax=Candidatus Thiosymbion oneisti TaxID=589554 RepID=UPI00105C4DAC|nr:lytic transglycosylase domain-containing protein [Candidatus Thiosymbion oneisti]
MKNVIPGLLLVLIGIPFPCSGDLYRYLDADGKLYFTDAPLKGSKYHLEWKRATKKLIEESNNRFIVFRRRLPVPSNKIPALSKQLSVRRKRYAALIERTARRFKLRPELLHAVIRAESAYNPTAVSSAGAIGLMQLMPATAARYKVSDPYDPAQNVRGGAQYLRFLLKMFGNNLRLALAGYNAGENAVVKHGNQVPPYPETQQYVRKVLQFLWAEQAMAKR